MRGFTVSVAAIVLGVDHKMLDNLLSHHAVPGCARARQGVRRRLTTEAILHVAVALLLVRELGVPLARALALAAGLVAGGRHEAAAGSLALTLDVAAMRLALVERIAAAVEGVREPKRGRPPRTR